MPAIGYEGQSRIVAATVAVAGDDLTAEVVARALGAAGVGALRLIRRAASTPAVTAALAGSNPDGRVEARAWPRGPGWVEALEGCALIVRSGFDDDAMLRAAIRLGIPAIVVRADDARVDLVSFRRQGPCPHLALDLPEVPAAPTDEGPAAVVAAHTAAAEALLVLAEEPDQAGTEAAVPNRSAMSPPRMGEVPARARARATHLRLPLDGGAPRTADIPWTPECFACGGTGTEMTFA